MLSYKDYILESILNWDDGIDKALNILKYSKDVNVSNLSNQLISSKNRDFDIKLSKSDFNLKYIGNNMVKIDDRIDMRFGRFIKYLFPDISNDHIGSFLSELESVMNNLDMSKNFKIVNGQQIKEYYRASKSHMKSTLGGSCMVNCLEYMNIYYDNPDKISLLIWQDDPLKIKGRALLWKMDNGLTYMDRIYYSEESLKPLFVNKAETEGWCWNDGKGNIYHNSVKIDNLRKLCVTLKNVDYLLYPYMDTFKYKVKNKLYCKSVPGIYEVLGNTDGAVGFAGDYSDVLKKGLLLDQTTFVYQKTHNNYSVTYKNSNSHIYSVISENEVVYRCIDKMYSHIYDIDMIKLWIENIKKYFLFDEYSKVLYEGGYKNINLLISISSLYPQMNVVDDLIKVIIDEIEVVRDVYKPQMTIYNIISIIGNTYKQQYVDIFKKVMDKWRDKIIGLMNNLDFVSKFIFDMPKNCDFFKYYLNETMISIDICNILYPSIEDKIKYISGRNSVDISIVDLHDIRFIIQKL